MITVKLSGDDFDRNGFVYVGQIAHAVLDALGGKVAFTCKTSAWFIEPSVSATDTRERYPILRERAVWAEIDAAVMAGHLRPIDPDTRAQRGRDDIVDAVVPLDAVRVWGEAIGSYRFVVEDAKVEKVGAGDTAADDPALPWAGKATSALPATAKEIAAAFPVPWADKWPDRLKKAAGGKSYQWLTGTVVHRGSRKPGDANTYSPAAVAFALVLQGEMTRAACDAAIKRCFPAWLDEWNSKCEYLQS